MRWSFRSTKRRPSEIAGLVEQLLAKDDLQIGPDALHRFIELAGTSRGLVRREAEKLALYCLGAQRVSSRGCRGGLRQ